MAIADDAASPAARTSAIRRRRRGVVAWLLATVGAAVLLVVLRDATDPLPGALEGQPAAAFVDSVGVNVHVSYYDTAYARFPEWSARLRELGVRHVRDGLVIDQPQYVERHLALAAQGVKTSFIVPLRFDRPPDDSIALVAGALRPALEALEGPNEPDLGDRPGWDAEVRGFMPALRAALDRRPDLRVPLLGPSLIRLESRPKVAEVAGSWTVENVHTYPAGEQPTVGLLQTMLSSRTSSGDRPIRVTETGYHNAVAATDGQPPVPEQVAADYVPRTFLDAFAAGAEKTYLYELIDEKPDPELRDPEQHFGLLRQDLSPKPAFDALRNLLSVIRTSPGNGDRRAVAVRTDKAEVQRLLLDRPDGSRVLLLWRRVSRFDPSAGEQRTIPDVNVGLAFRGAVEDAAIHRPSRTSAPVGRPDGVETLSVPVGADVVAVSFR